MAPKALLDEEQKRKNHVRSEQNRRGGIHKAFDRLTTIIPTTEGMGRSEAYVLREFVRYANQLKQDRAVMLRQMWEHGIYIEDKFRSPEMTPWFYFIDVPIPTDK